MKYIFIFLSSFIVFAAITQPAFSEDGFFMGATRSLQERSGSIVAPKTVNSRQTCTFIDFEGLVPPDDPTALVPVGTIMGSPNVTFGADWIAGLDADVGGLGNFANEPSPDTATSIVEDTGEIAINFDAGVQFMEVFYTAAPVSVPLTLTAYDGPNGTGNVVATAVGETVGTYPEVNCHGDPTGTFCLWDVLKLTTSSNVVRSLTLTGFEENLFGFDDMTYCTFGAFINIKPGSDPNSINTCSGGTTPVAILGSESFDVTTVDQTQLMLASAGVKSIGKPTDPKTQCSFQDIGRFDDTMPDNLGDPDGIDDLTCHFVTTAMSALDELDTTADLTIIGCDAPDNMTGSIGGCDSDDAGFYEIAATDTVNIVKSCN